MSDVIFSTLIGHTLVKVEGAEAGSGEIIFTSGSNGSKFKMYHRQDCCEGVSIESITGDITDLLDTPILVAEETSRDATSEETSESGTWTFYKLATVKGWVDIRWLGTSNGYYSESVSFEEIPGVASIVAEVLTK
jgi:hypothetical protein